MGCISFKYKTKNIYNNQNQKENSCHVYIFPNVASQNHSHKIVAHCLCFNLKGNATNCTLSMHIINLLLVPSHGDHFHKAASAGGEHINWNNKSERKSEAKAEGEKKAGRGYSDAGRQKQSGGNRMLSYQAHWNIHHPTLFVFPSYLPFQSVLRPPVSHPLRQPDLLQLPRGFLKVPNACLAKDSFSYPFLGLLDGWSRVWTSLPHPPPPSVLCVKRRRVMFETGRCFQSPMR